MEIRQDNLKGAKIQALLNDHLTDAYQHSPSSSVHALDLSALQEPEITFWSVWENDILLGCGALKELSPTHGELKSMRTTKAALRRGVGSIIVKQILSIAKLRGYTLLSLETGTTPNYKPAQALYEKFEFKECQPFANYQHDEFSLYMNRKV